MTKKCIPTSIIDEEEYYTAYQVAEILNIPYLRLIKCSKYSRMPFLKLKAKRYYRKSYIDELKKSNEHRDK